MSELRGNLRSSFERVGVPILSAVVGGVAVYAYMLHRPVSGQSPDQTPSEILANTRPCAPDPLHYEKGDRRYVIADGRCQNEEDGTINVFSMTNNSVLGPVAEVKSGTPMEAICTLDGQKLETKDTQYTSDEWVLISLQNIEGVTFKTKKSEGFVSGMDVVAEGDLPTCAEGSKVNA